MTYIKFILFSFVYFLSFQTTDQDFQSVRESLEAYQIKSLQLRANIAPIVRNHGFNSPQMDSLNQLIEEYDSINLAKIEPHLKQNGWLGKSKIGPQANSALFLLIQHAQKNQVREQYLPLLEKSAQSGESEKADWATMYDRVQVENGKKQKYGTQSFMKDGSLVLYPVDDPENLNKRRKQVGLKKIKH